MISEERLAEIEAAPREASIFKAEAMELVGSYRERAKAQPEPKAEKQEPAFFVVVDATGSPEYTALWPEFCHAHINDSINEYLIEGAEKWKVVSVYTAPPDLTAEVERNKRERPEVQCGDYEAAIRERAQRVAELEAALENARERFDKLARPHYGNSFGNQIAVEAIATIDEVLQ